MNLLKSKTIEQNDGFYFPLFNLKGFRSTMSPFFTGDLKLDHHHYVLEPMTELDLFKHCLSRNIIFYVDGKRYQMNGQSFHQKDDILIYETGLLYQKITRKNQLFDVEVTSYVHLDDNIELHEVAFTNRKSECIKADIHTEIPIYARSADNLRDHRHVTSLLNQIEVIQSGIVVKPTLSFDERGHLINNHIYSVSTYSDQANVTRYQPVLDAYINGGSLSFPKGEFDSVPIGFVKEGYEAIGAIGYEPIYLKPNETFKFYIGIGIHQTIESVQSVVSKHLNETMFHDGLNQVKVFFNTFSKGLSFQLMDETISKQLSWVYLQPLLRRYFGNSYLPHHDYGRGGRGWRDLWQDLLALIMNNDDSVEPLLFNNFAGVRIDGSNATIIGDQIGEFKADRNQITRVWSDHGAWPFLTVKMYLDETGDLAFLLKEQNYFMDQFIYYTRKTRDLPKHNIQTDASGNPYQGTVLEHLLIQNLVAHHNTGNHGFVRLEDADWNDGLDMAHGLGETIAFTHFYAKNLSELALCIKALGTADLKLSKDIKLLLKKDADLKAYFKSVEHFNGEKILIDSNEVIDILNELSKNRIEHLHKTSFKDDRFLSYYDNNGKLLDTQHSVNLTGQTMALLSQTASHEQARSVANLTKNALYKPEFGGYQLNSNYGKVLTNMGRAFGFAYGHKENGAVFSHMAIMYAYGLYNYNLVSNGREAFYAILSKSISQSSKVWVGIPEYFNDQGIGKYSYLTGSASWMLKLIRTKVFGLEFNFGDLYIHPRLAKEDFIEGKASITTYVFKKLITVTFHNHKGLNFGAYSVSKILMNFKEVTCPIKDIQGDIEVYLDEIA